MFASLVRSPSPLIGLVASRVRLPSPIIGRVRSPSPIIRAGRLV